MEEPLRFFIFSCVFTIFLFICLCLPSVTLVKSHVFSDWLRESTLFSTNLRTTYGMMTWRHGSRTSLTLSSISLPLSSKSRACVSFPHLSPCLLSRPPPAGSGRPPALPQHRERAMRTRPIDIRLLQPLTSPFR